MTICLAAIGSNLKEECIVFSTDHMVSTNVGQFEHSIMKYRQLNKTTVVMLAGDPLILKDLSILPKKIIEYSDVKKHIFQNFKRIREEKINGSFRGRIVVIRSASMALPLRVYV